ncbi:alpha/beta fold hydrolase [Psychrobacillus sp. OK032]|uniref:alpha/beta fold hydrolase n=1 Tax=Psychrobacillus sp. OK032 TaxID=1884358 RepID=UPI0015A70871|nr:alpha/beta hydrolase [Psychrobacillus sp. OK032]
MENGEYQIDINGVIHWIKVEGKENNTIPLVIIHGGPGGNLYTFERTVGPFLQDRTVIYYEQRGCGRSGKSIAENAYTINELVGDFCKIIQWTESEKVDLLGYSFGGELALEFAFAFPELINKIILSGPSLINLKTQYMIQISGFLSIAEQTLVTKIDEILQENTPIESKYSQIWEIVDEETIDRLLFVNQDVAKKFRQFIQESNLHNTGLMLAALQENPVTPPLYERLNDIHHKTLIITGVYDRNTGIPISNLINRNLSNSEWILFNKSAHFPDLEETEKFVSEVLDFLKA